MRSRPTGGRPAPPHACGYTGSISAHNSAHGTICSISARNCSRRVRLRNFSKLSVQSVCWHIRFGSVWHQWINSYYRQLTEINQSFPSKLDTLTSVSYTHLTLPTIYSV